MLQNILNPHLQDLGPYTLYLILLIATLTPDTFYLSGTQPS